MKDAMTIAAACIGLAALAGCDVEDTTEATMGVPEVGSDSDLSSFEGARAGQAEMGIQSLGYQAIRSDGLTTWWFNPDTGACARIVTSDGRYSSVDMLPSGDC